MRAPEVLLSGHHAKLPVGVPTIVTTYQKRSTYLLAQANLNEEEQRWLDKESNED